MSRAKWSALDWYKTANFFLILGGYLTFIAPLSGGIPWVDIPSSTAVIMGVGCFLLGILHRLEAILEQISPIDFERILSTVKRTEEERDE
jgi:hypothetical protein